jgi:hypothetical protein
MPSPLAGIIVALEAFLGEKLVEGSSNLIQGIDVLVNWSKAQDGVKYNNYTFDIPNDSPKTNDNAKTSSIAKAVKNAKTNSTTMLPSAKDIVASSGIVLPILTITTSSKLKSVNMNNKLIFAVALRFSNSNNYFNTGHVILLSSKGFATNIGDQAEFEFQGTKHSDSKYLLTFNGQVNPLFSNNVRVSGAVVISKSGEIVPNGFWEATTNQHFNTIPSINYWNNNKGFDLSLL